MSDNGALGRRMPPSRGGDCESRARGNAAEFGELKEVGGAEPAEYTETVSSQSLAPLPDCTLEDEDTELRLARPNSRGSFLTSAILALGLTVPFDCFLALLPARNSSKRRGRGRRWVRS